MDCGINRHSDFRIYALDHFGIECKPNSIKLFECMAQTKTCIFGRDSKKTVCSRYIQNRDGLKLKSRSSICNSKMLIKNNNVIGWLFSHTEAYYSALKRNEDNFYIQFWNDFETIGKEQCLEFLVFKKCSIR